jgi:hypothetical protein
MAVTPKGSDQASDGGRVHSRGDADDQPAGQKDLARGIRDHADRGELRGWCG